MDFWRMKGSASPWLMGPFGAFWGLCAIVGPAGQSPSEAETSFYHRIFPTTDQLEPLRPTDKTRILHPLLVLMSLCFSCRAFCILTCYMANVWKHLLPVSPASWELGLTFCNFDPRMFPSNIYITGDLQWLNASKTTQIKNNSLQWQKHPSEWSCCLQRQIYWTLSGRENL